MDDNPYIWVSPFASIIANSIFQRSEETQTQDFVWMQFTWLFDKNLIEVYEWDIVKWAHNKMKTGIYKVYFNDIVLAWYIWWEQWDIHLCDLENIEIIWNIYANPDLLK